MDIHVCKQCGSHFVYCRACVFKPIRYKDNGFCSKECYEASKNKVVAPEIIEKPVLVEELEQVEEIIEDVVSTEEEVEAETIVLTETPIIETTTPIVKKETNTYKKKKNKYRVHE